MRRNMPVGSRIPFAVIDAVDNAAELEAALGQHTLEAAAKVVRLNLPRIAGADSAEPIGEDNAGLQVVEMIEVFKLLPVEQPPGKTGRFKQVFGKSALVSQVVQCE